MKCSKHVLAASVAASLIGAAAAAPYPHGRMTAYDMGPASLFADNSQITVTVALNLRNRDQLEQLVVAPPAAPVVCVQNGVENERRVLRHFPNT